MEQKPQKIEQKEFITEAAIKFENGEIFTGKKHVEILQEAFEKFLDPPGAYTEGFKTSKGRFLTRGEAADIAFKAGQIKKPSNRLQSQDLNL